MAEHEPDGVNEAFQASARVAITAGGLIAERIVRQREQAYRDAEAASRQQARELQARLEGERGAARAALAPVGREEWWERAGAEQIGAAWETANAWQEIDADAQRTTERMRDELRRRYAIDTDSLGAGPAAVQEALERRERELRPAANSREQARAEQAQATALLIAAARAEGQQERDQQERDPGPGPDDPERGQEPYDSAERRRELASELEGVADAETIEARVIADTNQARPAEEAVASGPRRTPRARRARGEAGQVRSPARRSERGR